MKKVHWKTWLRSCLKDPGNPIELPAEVRTMRNPLAMLTPQDTRTLDAIVTCWQLYFGGDEDAGTGALGAVRALLPALQPQCRVFARELIPYAGDWDHRWQLWPLVTEVDQGPALVLRRGDGD